MITSSSARRRKIKAFNVAPLVLAGSMCFLGACSSSVLDPAASDMGSKGKKVGLVGSGGSPSTATPTPTPTPTALSSTTTYDTSVGTVVDADGFASLPLRSGAHRYFVKNGGSDANGCSNAQNPATPLATIAAGMACVTAGNGDQVVLAEGSTFNEKLPWLSSKGGYSAQYPTVISSYNPADPTNESEIGRGDQRGARPVLNPGGALVDGGPVSYIAIKGLDFNPGNIPGQGLTFNGDGTNGTGGANYVLIENNLFRYSGITLVDGGDGYTTTPRTQHLIIRNNSIYGVWSSTDAQHVGGIYVEGADGVTIEDNVIWHTGWKVGVSRDTGPNTGGPTIFNHPIYLQANCGTEIVRRNLVMDNSADGGIARGSNITWQENVAIKSPNGFGLGAGNPQDFTGQPNGSLVDASYNLSVGAVDLTSTQPRGQGYTLANLASGSKIHNNLLIYSDATPNSADQAVATTGGSGYGFPTRPTYTDFENNVAFHWSASSLVVLSQFGSPITSTYANNLWDEAASGTNGNSQTAVFPQPYTQAQLYSALTPTYPSITDYNSLVNYAIAHPEAHVQRTLRSLAFAGYGL